MFLLKEMANFSTFFAKVRQGPYNAKKCAKISHFFKQKHAIYDSSGKIFLLSNVAVFITNLEKYKNFLQNMQLDKIYLKKTAFQTFFLNKCKGFTFLSKKTI